MQTIPPEIEAAFNQPYGFVLLIKGRAGTGKTTLALEVLRTIHYKKPIYISTRISSELLYKQFPWIEGFLPKDNIIDATNIELNRFSSEPEEKPLLDPLHLQRLPDFMKVLFSKLNHTSPGMLIIDSWNAIEALLQAGFIQTNTLFAGYILELIRQRNLNLILIEETEKESYLDYLCDGIICLKESLLDNKLIRRAYISKIRGIPISQPTHLFTLNNGRFTSFSTTENVEVHPFKIQQIIPDTDSKVSTGIPDFDRILNGGLPKGSVLLFEIDPSLSRMFGFFTINMSANFLLQNRPVISVIPPGRDISTEEATLQELIGGNMIFNELVRVIEIGKQRADMPPYLRRFLPETNIDFFFNIRSVALEIPKTTEAQPTLILFSLETVSYTFPPLEIKRDLLRIRSEIIKAGNVLLIIAKTGDELIQEFERLVKMHFVFTRINHKFSLYGKNPETSYYAVNFDTSEAKFNIKLIPIV